MSKHESAAMTFALRDGELVHVDEVPRGGDCGCLCPGCGESLLAKHGAIKVHHFAHQSGSECSGGLETSLHLAAKAILGEHRRMALPSLEVHELATDSEGKMHRATRVMPAKVVEFDEVQQELRLGSIIPDILARVGGRSLLVEVAVHHRVDLAKLQKIHDLGVACVEVDLSGALRSGWTRESLRQCLLESQDTKAWLYNPWTPKLRSEARRDAEAMASFADKKRGIDRQAIERAHAIQRQEIPGFAQELAELVQWMDHDVARALRLAELDEHGHQHPVWTSVSRVLGVSWSQCPTYFKLRHPGDEAIGVASQVWQAGIFALFAKSRPGRSFTKRQAVEWVVSTFECHHRWPTLLKHRHLLTAEQNRVCPSASKAVVSFLNLLLEHGLLRQSADRLVLA